jgi:hypothetical protein
MDRRFEPANRRRLSRPGLRTSLAIADLWVLTEEQRQCPAPWLLLRPAAIDTLPRCRSQGPLPLSLIGPASALVEWAPRRSHSDGLPAHACEHNSKIGEDRHTGQEGRYHATRLEPLTRTFAGLQRVHDGSRHDRGPGSGCWSWRGLRRSGGRIFAGHSTCMVTENM